MILLLKGAEIEDYGVAISYSCGLILDENLSCFVRFRVSTELDMIAMLPWIHFTAVKGEHSGTVRSKRKLIFTIEVLYQVPLNVATLTMAMTTVVGDKTCIIVCDIPSL